MTAVLMIENPSETTNAPVLEAPIGEDRVMPLDQLDLSENNARKKVHPADVQRMAAFLEAQGQLHPLLIHIGADGRGKVHAGGMRLRGMWLNRDSAKIASDAPVKVTVYAEERALELSTAENVGRTAMHAADEIEAFTAMVAKGLSYEQVAARFAVSKLTVERRVKLGNLAPVFLDLFRDDKIDTEQLKALSLTDDHAKQIAVWEALPKYDNSAYRIRQMLVDEDQEIDGDSNLAKFVGLENYRAAGGVIRSDLFSDDGDCALVNGALVTELALKRLEQEAELERAKGWSWVETRLETSYMDTQGMDRERAHARKMTDEEAEQLEDWKALQADAQNVFNQLRSDLATLEEEDADTEELDTQCEEALAAVEGIREVITLLHASLAEWTKKQLATCGVILSIGHSGSLEVRAGLMKASDRKAIDKAQIEKLKEAGKPIPASLQAAASKGDRAAYSERLMLDMTAHRTAAMQAALTDNAHVALALTVHSMVMPIFSTYDRASSPLKLSITETTDSQLSGRASEYEGSPAAETMSAGQDKWGNRVPGGDSVTVYRWLLKQDNDTLMELLAFCAASSLDAMHGRERGSFDMSDALAESLDLDMADWWTPTAGKYLGSVSKVQLIEAVTEVESAEAAKPMATMKKGDAVAFAAAKLDGKRWLPSPLKRMASSARTSDTDTDSDQE